MPQSLSKILLHLVFSTKHRQPIIPPTVEPELYPYLAAVCKSQGSHCYRVGGTADHVHLACTLPRVITVSALLEEIKKRSSKWIKGKDETCRNFAWQAGYGAFSLGQSQLETLLAYIDRQKEHHRERTFKEEFVELLQRYQVDCNEKHLWNGP